MSINTKKLEFWATNKYNVIFCGRHGVGKTSIVEALFNKYYGEQGEDWLYFSAATMDPWVDFIGVPKEKEDGDGVSYLEMVRPKVFALDQVKAIFFDEFNRSPKKVRNAVMELMQFKSINGHKFHNLEIIWGAINPPEDDDENFTYDVEQIDPAQLDRFHIYIDLPYTVSKTFFKRKYGEVEGTAACDWWNSLSQNHKDAISPRRLDYAVGCWAAGGDMKDVLPKGISTSELQRQLKSGSYKKRLNGLLSDGEVDDEQLAEEVADERMFAAIQDKMMKEQDVFNRVFPVLEEEKMVQVATKFVPKVLKERLQGIGKNERVAEILGEAIRRKRKFLTAAKVREIRTWKNTYHPDEVDENTNNEYEQRLYAIMGDNNCSSKDERSIETENTYYRNKRLEDIAAFFRYGNNVKALDDNTVKPEIQYEFFNALAMMCNRYNEDTLRRAVGVTLTKSNKQDLRRFIRRLEDNEEYGENVINEIDQNDKLRKYIMENTQ